MTKAKMTRIGFGAATFAVMVLAACGGGGGVGGSDDTGGTGTPGPDTASAFCDTLYDTFAQRYADCSKAPLAWATEFIDKGKLCANLVKAVEGGIATYDTYAAGRCLARFEGATCNELRAVRDFGLYVAECEAAVTGTRANSGTSTVSCYSDWECGSGRCSGYGATCPGMCWAGRGLGVDCGNDHDCAVGLYCYYGSLWPNHTCQPVTNQPGLDQVCALGTPCKPGLYCEGSSHSSMPGVCKPLLTAGACTGDRFGLAPGYGCFSSTVQPLLGPGETCQSSPDHCGPGLYCGAGNVCTQEPFVGEPCVKVGSVFQGCIGGVCDGVNCVAQVETCYSDWDCDSNGYCLSGTCAYFCAAP